MSSGLGEWEKGIPCMLQGSWQQACWGMPPWPPQCPVCPITQSEPSSSGSRKEGGWWLLFTTLISTLAHKGK